MKKKNEDVGNRKEISTLNKDYIYIYTLQIIFLKST